MLFILLLSFLVMIFPFMVLTFFPRPKIKFKFLFLIFIKYIDHILPVNIYNLLTLDLWEFEFNSRGFMIFLFIFCKFWCLCRGFCIYWFGNLFWFCLEIFSLNRQLFTQSSVPHRVEEFTITTTVENSYKIWKCI